MKTEISLREKKDIFLRKFSEKKKDNEVVKDRIGITLPGVNRII